MSIVNGGRFPPEVSTGDTIFNDRSSAGGASIVNASAELDFDGDIGRTTFNGASTADHAAISNYGAGGSHGIGGQTIFNGTSTAANASIDNGGSGEVSTAESASDNLQRYIDCWSRDHHQPAAALMKNHSEA